MVRVKRRYIVIKINFKNCPTSNIPDDKAFINELRDKIYQTHGDFGVACLNRGFSVKKYDPLDGNMILGVRREFHKMVMSNIPLICSVNRIPCSASIFHLSGTLRGCLKELKLDYLKNLRATIAQKQSRDGQKLIHSNKETFIVKKVPESKVVQNKKKPTKTKKSGSKSNNTNK